MNISSSIARSCVRFSLLGVLTLLLVACGAPGTNSGTTNNKIQASTYSTASLAPTPNAVESRCLVGGRPLALEFIGVDANNMCAKYVPVLADLGYPNLPIHDNTQESDIPAGFSVGCGLIYPLSFGNLYAYVYGYTNGDVNGDAGPQAAKVCTKLLTLGWMHGG